MKKFFYIFLALILIVWVIYFVLSLSLKPFLLSQLNQALKTRVEAKSVSLSFPFNLEFGRLIIFDKGNQNKILSAEKAKIGLNPFSFLSQRILLNHFILINPVIMLEKSTDGSLNISDLFNQAPAPSPRAKGAKTLLLLRAEIKNGEIEFLDKTIYPSALTRIKNLNLKIAKVSFPPVSAAANFRISFDLVNLANEVKGRWQTRGWVNVIKKDMSAEAQIKNLDITYFMPYYKSGFSSVEKGILNFTGDIDSKSNNLTAACRLEVNELSFVKGNQPATDLFGVSVSDLARYLKNSDGKIIMNFTLRGTMDKPQEMLSQATGIVVNYLLQKAVKSQMERLLELGEKTGQEAGKAKDSAGQKIDDIKKVFEGIFK